MKEHIFLIILLLAILGLIIVNIFGVFEVFVLSDTYNTIEFIIGFFATFVFLCFGVAFISYEGRGTSTNMLINGMFYFFLITIIAILIIYLVKIYRKAKNLM